MDLEPIAIIEVLKGKKHVKTDLKTLIFPIIVNEKEISFT